MLDFIPSQTATAWVVYSHVFNGQYLYIGKCRLLDVISAPDARSNTIWHEFTRKNPTASLRLSVIGVFDTEDAAAACQAGLVLQFKPWGNVSGKPMPPRLTNSGASVQCVETGEIFINAAAAARANNVAASAMANHLNGKPYCKTVGGKTFKRTNQ